MEALPCDVSLVMLKQILVQVLLVGNCNFLSRCQSLFHSSAFSLFFVYRNEICTGGISLTFQGCDICVLLSDYLARHEHLFCYCFGVELRLFRIQYFVESLHHFLLIILDGTRWANLRQLVLCVWSHSLYHDERFLDILWWVFDSLKTISDDRCHLGHWSLLVRVIPSWMLGDR